MTRSSLPRFWEQGMSREGQDGCWVGKGTVLGITTLILPYTALNTEIAEELNITAVL